MGILVSELDGGWTDFSTSGDQTNPISTTHDGRIEQPRERLLYVRNDDSNKSYASIVVDFIDYTYPNDIEGAESGWNIKVKLGSLQPSEAEWAAITAGDPLSIPDIVGVDSEPFWYKIVSPRGLNVGLKLDIAMQIDYIESTI